MPPRKILQRLLPYLDRDRFLLENPDVDWEEVEAALGGAAGGAPKKRKAPSRPKKGGRAASKGRRSVDSIVAYTDGASRGNPGPAGIGVYLVTADGDELEEVARGIGRATNNEAEYGAVITAARRAGELGVSQLLIRTDSELVARHLTGQYRVKSPKLQPLYREALSLLGRLKSWRIESIPREENRDADRLANRGIDEGE